MIVALLEKKIPKHFSECWFHFLVRFKNKITKLCWLPFRYDFFWKNKIYMWWLRLAGQSTCIGKVCSFYINSILSNLSFSSDQPPIYNRTSLLTLKKEKTKNKTKILCFTWCISLYTLQLFYLFIFFKKYTPTIVIFFLFEHLQPE